MLRRWVPAMVLVAGSMLPLGCAGGEDPPPARSVAGPESASLRVAERPPRVLEPVRGVILISLDTLRADHLSLYGHERETSPFLTELAERSVVFDRVVAPYPATLVSHMSMFTGLYPGEHGVYPPDVVLSDEITTFPERLSGAGFRTAGFTEGGFVAGGYGFSRGFDLWADPSHSDDTDIEKTLGRGLEFLEGLGAEERFFLFLHSYAVHDPYAPPEPWRQRFAPTDPSSVELSRGEHLRDVNFGRAELAPETVEDFRRLYDGSIAYVDDVLRDFTARLEALGILEDLALVITSDHGEEFREHGRVGHLQLYPETLFVPLMIRHPGIREARRVPGLVSLVDLAPTVADLVGVEVGSGSGVSVAGCLTAPQACGAPDVFAEVSDQERNRALITEVDGRPWQVHQVGLVADPDGSWVVRRAVFDADGPVLDFRSRSFHRSRSVAIHVDGAEVARFEVTPEWGDFRVDLPRAGRVRVVLEADGCDVPAEVEGGGDQRCLSLIVQGPPLRRSELYDLEADPLATRDLSFDHPDLHRRLARRLAAIRWTPVAVSGQADLSEDKRRELRELGYLD